MENDTKEGRATPPPYVAYKTFKNFLRSLSATIPSRIDKSVMPSLSGGTQAQILHALKYLKLIDADTGAPQANLTRLVKSEGAEHQKVLREVLEANYPFLRDKNLDLSNATHKLLEDAFKGMAQGDTLRKCVTFFIPAATEAGIKLSPYIKTLGKRTEGSKPRKPRAPKSAGGGSSNPTPDPAEHKTPPPPPALSWHEMLLSKFPSFDPSWSPEVQAKWFENFSTLMNSGDKSGGNK